MSTSERILFIDDDKPVRTAFARTLKMHGYEVDVADGAEQAVQLATDNNYAVIATDYRMPRVNGLDLVDELRVIRPHATYVLVSGQCDLDLALEAVNKHAVANVITKPWDTMDLSSLVRRGVESYWERTAQTEVQQNLVATSRRLEAQQQRLQEALANSEAMAADILLNALDLRDHETRAHCRRVAEYARMIADELGIRGRALVTIRQGALLHDVGKMGVPDSILRKPGPLTEEEWEVMRQHPRLGANLLAGFESLEAARSIVLYHHERWDGTGYPKGLAGESIVLGARVFSVADTIDAMLSDRPYRSGLPLETVIEEVRSSAGKQHDPAVVEATLRIPPQRWLEVRAQFPDDECTEMLENSAA